jgi:membrane fusion protein, multidrug efflux system
MQSTVNQAPPRSRKIWWLLGAIVVVGLLTTVVVLRQRSSRQSATAARSQFNAPITVGTGRVTLGDVPITIDALGTVTPLATVTVHPQVTGPLVKIPFTEGQIVKAGDLLAQIDPRPFQATLDQALGSQKRDEALLANARVDLNRYKTLLSQNSVAEQTYATQVATVAQDEATVATDKAAVESAQLNLEYCRITSPVTGMVGLRQVDIGNLVTANTSTIVVVTQMQPMSVLFPVPEDNLGSIMQRMTHGQKLSVDAFDRTFTSKLADGYLSNNDDEVDPTTGTLKFRAMFDNKSNELFPDQFVNVRVLLDTLSGQVVVPGAAVLNGASGSYVYLIDPATSTVSMRQVSTGPSSGDKVSVRSGLKVGDIVVTDGADQLRDGARVVLPNATGYGPGAESQSQRHGTGGQHRRRPEGGAGAGGAPGGGPPPG